MRSHLPRFIGDNLTSNQRMVDRLREIAAGKRISGVQLAIAWVLAKKESIVPVIGARTRTQLTESLSALQVSLSPEDIAALEAAVPATGVAGTRYNQDQMRALDSEK